MNELFDLLTKTEDKLRELYDPTVLITIEFAPSGEGYLHIKPLNSEEGFEIDFDDYDGAIELLTMLSTVTEEKLIELVYKDKL